MNYLLSLFQKNNVEKEQDILKKYVGNTEYKNNYLDLLFKKDNCGFTYLHNCVMSTENVPQINTYLKDNLKTKFYYLINELDSKGRTALQYRILYLTNDTALETIQILIDAGADVNVKDHQGRNSLHCAMTIINKQRQYKVIEMLLNADVNITSKDACNKTILHHLMLTNNYNYDSKFTKWIIDLSIANKININAKDKHGNTTLHYALKRPYIFRDFFTYLENILILVKNGADVYIQNECGKNALWYIERRFNKFVDSLREPRLTSENKQLLDFLLCSICKEHIVKRFNTLPKHQDKKTEWKREFNLFLKFDK